MLLGGQGRRPSRAPSGNQHGAPVLSALGGLGRARTTLARMDLTPQVINEVEFSMARRGYDPDQVDEFLEKVASKVEEANQRVAALRVRLVAPGRRAAAIPAAPSAGDGSPEEASKMLGDWVYGGGRA